MRKMYLSVAVASAVLIGFTLPAAAAQTSGLATNVGVGGFAVSAGLGYVERDVEDRVDDETSSRRLAVRVQFGLFESVDVYALAGFADVKFDVGSFEGTLGENLGLGAHYQLLSFADSDTKLMLDLQGQYYRSADGATRMRHFGYHAATYLLKEIGAAGRVGYFYPYGGVRVSYGTFDGNNGAGDWKGEDLVGVFGGADYFVNPNIFFSGEVHVFDETSLYMGVGYRF